MSRYSIIFFDIDKLLQYMFSPVCFSDFNPFGSVSYLLSKHHSGNSIGAFVFLSANCINVFSGRNDDTHESLAPYRTAMAEYLASIFGTEKDKVNCSFFFKIGACRHGDRCSRWERECQQWAKVHSAITIITFG